MPTIQTILNDQTFQNWCQKDVRRCADSIDLYNAIFDFESQIKTLNSLPPFALMKVARFIHRKYVSLNTGSCHVIDNATRTQMSSRIHELLDGKSPYSGLFDPLKPPLNKHLQFLYSEFASLTTDDATTTNDTINPIWETSSASTDSESEKKTPFWFNDESVERSSCHETQMATTVTHDDEDSRFEFFNAVCNRLSSLQENQSSSSVELKEEQEETISEEQDEELETTASGLMSFLDSEEHPHQKRAPYGRDGFAPPPQLQHDIPLQVPVKTQIKTVPNLPRRFESLYRKKRHQPAAASESSGFSSGVSEFSNFERYGRSNGNTLDRRTGRNTFLTNGFSTLQPRKRNPDNFNSILTLELRYENDVPMVAKINQQQVTFRYFRHLFGVHHDKTSRYFFKSNCEDGSALYQWTLIYHDDDQVPTFQGKITAICRVCPASELVH